nr:transposase [Waterburya agarophytonicola]
MSEEDKIIAQPVPPPPPAKATVVRAESNLSKRVEQYEQVHALNQQGWTKIAIANKLGISRRKVFRFLKSATFPERKGRSDRGKSLLSPYNKYLLERWNEGCHNGTKLLQEIQEQGYQGSYATVAAHTRRLRDTQQLQKGESKINQSELKVFEPKKSLLTVRRAVKLILRKPSQKSDSDNQAISLLKQQHPNLNTAIELVQSFANLVRNHEPEKLQEWYEKANSCQIKALENFARGIKEDWAAVKNGVTYLWSNGQVEGQVNRLKMLKRQMYGRASHELLKKRFLCPV